MRRRRQKNSTFSHQYTEKRTQTINDRRRSMNINEQRINSEKKAKKKTRRTGMRVFKSIVYSLFVCIFVCLIACLGVGSGMYAAIVQEVEEMNIHDLAITRSSTVYYNDQYGNCVEAATLFSDSNCIWIESNEIPDIMKEAIVSIEDERFYSHSGIDLKRSTGAIIGYIREKLGGSAASYGGSTITQQVVKNITQENERTATRKIKEMMRAVAIERELSKDEIITMYLNLIFLANNCYGVEAASNMYFDKNASELTLPEAAMIAGITQRPSYYDPLAKPENALKKRNTVLSKMYELGKITKEEYDEAKESDLGLSETHTKQRSKVYSYFIDSVINEVIRDLQTEKGYSESFATQQVFSGGLKIYTTMDINIQEIMEDVYENPSNFSGGASKAQSAMVIMDPKNGEIKGIIGGKGKKTESRGFNRATQSRRQPGSSIKPLSVYSPAIEKGIITPSTQVKDEPITIGKWEPKNAYTGFKGRMTVKKAVEISANIPAVKILQELGVNTSYDYVKNKYHLGITEADKDLSPLALGGLTNGVTPKEMAAAYCVFANNGIYNEPHTYTKVLDSSNRVLLEKVPESNRVIRESTAYIMTDMLYNVVNGYSGTGRLAKLNNMPTYGKTGTTNNNNDKWFVGYTPYYVGAVWFGFDQQKSLRSAGITDNISAKLWKKVMDRVHEGLQGKGFSASDDMVSAYICQITGQLASEYCDGVTEYFASGTEPTKYCSGEHFGSLDPEEIVSEEGEIVEELPQAPKPSDSGKNKGFKGVGDFIPIEELSPAAQNPPSQSSGGSVSQSSDYDNVINID